MRTVRISAAHAAIVLLLCGLISSCKGSPDSEKGQTIPTPRDEATAEERQQLDAGVAEIEAGMAELGQPHTFRTIPLVLTTDERSFTDRPAACITAGPRPQFIIVKRRVLEEENKLAAAGIEATLFRVLLHEIGHCYFGRSHDDTRITEEGRRVRFVLGDGEDEAKAPSYSILDASIMASDTLTLPMPLKAYYLSELLGLTRAKTFADLGKFAPMSYVQE